MSVEDIEGLEAPTSEPDKYIVSASEDPEPW